MGGVGLKLQRRPVLMDRSNRSVKLEGFKELDAEFDGLSNSIGKAILRRAGIIAAEPMARQMRLNAPKLDNDLSESIEVGTKLSPRQARLHRKMFRGDRDSVELFVGPGPDPAAWIQEFGNSTNRPQPFARPAFDQTWRKFLDLARVEIADQLNKAAERAARRAAKRLL